MRNSLTEDGRDISSGDRGAGSSGDHGRLQM